MRVRAAYAIVLCLGTAAIHANADSGWRFEGTSKDPSSGQPKVQVQQPSDAQLHAWWADWKAFYNKSYVTSQAESVAFTNFKANMHEALRVNQDMNISYWLAGNQFSDLDFASFRASVLMRINPLNVTKTRRQVLEEAGVLDSGDEALQGHGRSLLQSTVDWRKTGKLTPVKEQGSCGACWSFAATAAMESAYLLSQGTTYATNPIDLSEQHLADCVNSDNGYYSFGCYGGLSDEAMRYVVANYQTTEAKYPYQEMSEACNSDILATVTTGEMAKPRASFSYVKTKSEMALRNAVMKQPTVIYFDVEDSFYQYGGGIYKPEGCSTAVNHAMLLVGYSYSNNVSADYWIVRNSWGPTWGENG